MSERGSIHDATRRFSDRVENYIRYRPAYPDGVVGLLEREVGLRPGWVVADVGSGTGISAAMLVNAGCIVYGIEPNREMRMAAESILRKQGNVFRSLEGRAEATTLPDSCVDLVVAAQAFHWFDAAAARREFTRILRPGGWVVLIWNERKLDTTPFLQAYEDLLLAFATDYRQVRHENVTDEKLAEFFTAGEWSAHSLPNAQEFDYQGLAGRLLSSSYAPSKGQPNHEVMMKGLRGIFGENAVDGKVRFEYDTRVYIGR
ncbi:MAG TPA: methyltransferase domain-containing protein [Prosthecobacter sp.]|nr:methyltransferase domain-containing protein [Prosthecobacter sp.]